MKRKVLCILFMLTILYQIKAQEKWSIPTEYLSKADNVLIYKPDLYDKNKSYSLVYLLHGYTNNETEWSKTTDLQQLANQYQMIIVCPDAGITWYFSSSYNMKSRMEDFFFKDLVPKVNASYNINQKNVFISGLSMGGYGAMRYFALHPDYFNTAASTSGALEIDYDFLKGLSKQFFLDTRVTDELIQLVGDPSKVDWHQYAIKNLLKVSHLKKPFLIDCGTEDPLLPLTTALKETCDSLKIPLTYILQPGNHDKSYWNKSIEQHFVYFKQHIQ
jgi:putative tributyrin esterase